MDASVTLTYLSAVERFITSGDRSGQPYYRAHFLTAEEEPVSFSISSSLYARFKNECKFGDMIDGCISIRSTPNGTYTQFHNFKS